MVSQGLSEEEAYERFFMVDKQGLLFDDMDDLNEEYYFDTIEEFQSERYFVLVIYDIVDNKKRLKLSKYLLGYGIRVQKSAFEMMITKEKYNKLIKELPTYIEEGEDSIRLYKILGKGQMKAWGQKNLEEEIEEVVII